MSHYLMIRRILVIIDMSFMNTFIKLLFYNKIQ